MKLNRKYLPPLAIAGALAFSTVTVGAAIAPAHAVAPANAVAANA